MNNNFDRLLKLAQKTKSTLVVYDRDGGEHCVVLGIDEFEKISGQAIDSSSEKGFQVPVSDPQDVDRESDEAVLEALNKKIAEWRAMQPEPKLEAPELNTDSTQEAPIPEVSTVDHAPVEPTQSITNPAQIQNSIKSSSWTKLGDVMAGSMRPKMPEVRYEELGEPEVALPIKRTDESESFSESEPLDDEPLFLEEPIS